MANGWSPAEVHPYEAIFAKLEKVETYSWGWKARCPAHADRKNSLSIQKGERDKLLLRCHAEQGCTFQRIIGALGITPQDCFADSQEGKRTMGRIAKTYDYVDGQGHFLFQVVRFEPKDFRQRRKAREGETSKDGWVWNLDGIRRVLYRLDLLEQHPGRAVFVVEGEKDADRLIREGLLATTCSGGAGKWLLTDASPLAGRPVIVIADIDPINPKTGKRPGLEHVRQVAADLQGKAASVRVLFLPVAEKEDVSDFLDGGGTIEQLKELASKAPLYEGGELEQPARQGQAEPVVVPAKLTLLDYAQVAQIGLLRRMNLLQAGEKGDRWKFEIESAAAELVVAQYLGLAWPGAMAPPRRGDLGKVQVRWRPNAEGQLYLREADDAERVYVLVRGQEGAYEMVGWIRGQEGKQTEWRRTWSKRRQEEVYFVPDASLKPMKELSHECGGK